MKPISPAFHAPTLSEAETTGSGRADGDGTASSVSHQSVQALRPRRAGHVIPNVEEALRPRHTGRSNLDAAMVRNRAADAIIRGMRMHVANKTSAAMMASGMIWREIQKDLRATGTLGADESLTLQRLSSLNLSALRKRLGTLNEAEIRFFHRFTSQRFFATHFTDADLHRACESGQTLSMLSRKKLLERDIEFNEENTPDEAFATKADDDHVFFALECGAQPQKFQSRFGNSLYRIPFDTPVFRQSAWGALDDIYLTYGTGSEGKALKQNFPDIDIVNKSVQCAIASAIGPETDRDKGGAAAYADVFTCTDLVAAAGLSLIAKLRKIDDPNVEGLLNSTTPEQFNAVLNTFHRVEIRVPGHCFAKEFEHHRTSLHLRRWEESPDSLLEQPDKNQLKHLVEFCGSDPETVERQLGVLRDAGIDVTRIHGWNGQSLLHLLCDAACDFPDELAPSVRTLIPSLVKFGLDVNARTDNLRTPLMMALQEAGLASTLIDQGANVNALGPGGRTAIFDATREDVVELLIRHGADVHHRDDDGRNAFHWALSNYGFGCDLFHSLAAAGLPIDERAHRQVIAKFPAHLVAEVPAVNAPAQDWQHFFASQRASMRRLYEELVAGR